MLRTPFAVCLFALAVAAPPRPVCANDAVPSAAAGVPDRAKPPHLIVLQSGELLEGPFRVAPGGYEREVPGGGRVFLAESFLWFTAESREEAYQELRKRYPDKTADGHVALSRWCLKNRLYASAQDELRTALLLSPKHAEARTTLKILDEMLAPRSTAPGAAGRAAAPSSASPGEATLGGLPPETAREFVGKVQPILVNNCGNAACHGTTSKNPFRLRNVRFGNPGFKALTLRNLAAVREQLSPETPSSSPLLVAPQQPGHGGTRRPVFSGPGGDVQRRTLAAWVAAAAPTQQSVASQPDRSADAAVVLTSGVADPGADPDDHSDVSGMPQPSEPSSTTAAIDPASELIRRTLAEERPDAFDPAEFNRRFGPDAGQTPRSPSDGPTP